MPVDIATPGKWRAEHGMVLTKVEERDYFVALVELPRGRSKDAKEVLREQDANAVLMAHSKQMFFLLGRVEDHLKRQLNPEWSLLEELRLLRTSVKAGLD